MKKLILLSMLIGLIIGCSPLTPESENTVFGKCRFCGKPGYSTDRWVDPVRAQLAADKGNPSVASTIVCGECRRKMK